MLTSMTGHGQAQQTTGDVTVWAEVRSVNNRYLKVSLSCADRQAELESNVKSIVQEHVRRGTVHVNLEVQKRKKAAQYRINRDLLSALYTQLRTIDENATTDSLLALPGVIEDVTTAGNGAAAESSQDWELIEPVLREAVQQMVEMRIREGAALARDLLDNCGLIRSQLTEIEKRAPLVVEDYATRLSDRINSLLAQHEASISPSDIVREVGIFADKCDISEETVRLHSHIDQFAEIINSGQSDGRKLEFVSQEMLRETNTIGSKANDARIAQGVVEIKTAIERIREMTQNVE